MSSDEDQESYGGEDEVEDEEEEEEEGGGGDEGEVEEEENGGGDEEEVEEEENGGGDEGDESDEEGRGEETADDDDDEEPEEQLIRESRDHIAQGVEAVPSQMPAAVSGLKDGFGAGTMEDIVGQIWKISGGGGGEGGGGGLNNALAGGAIGALASQLIGSAAHHFLGINPETGRIIGAIAGNLIFGMGGRDNSLSGLGKLVLDNLVSGKFQRKVSPFVSPRPGIPSFRLDFGAERDRCLRERRLFEDPEFPASDQSLFFSKMPPRGVEWRRPGELVRDPQLLSAQRASRFDVVQGELGDCWMLAATAALTLREELFFRVVPPDQSFTENYAGIFHFQFWRYGQWVDVVIDDRLPTRHGQLLFMHSADGLSFWSALLEKAYAKLYGSYEALKGGSTAEALEDFTGGLIEHFELAELAREQLLTVLVRGFQMGSFFGCSIDADPSETEARLDNGLVAGHAYSITAIQPLGRHTVLLRVRNPWGEHEWRGRWADGAPEWGRVPEAERRRLRVQFAEDGEFWMELDDFHREFQRMECCNLGPEVLDEICQMMDVPQGATAAMAPQLLRPRAQWSQFAADGEWDRRRGTAGGCRNYPTFPQNPQFGALISLPAGDQSPEVDDRKCTVICAVMQKYRRELRSAGLDDLDIGFVVYSNNGGKGNSGREQQQQFRHDHHQVQAVRAVEPLALGQTKFGFGPGYGQPQAYGAAYGGYGVETSAVADQQKKPHPPGWIVPQQQSSSSTSVQSSTYRQPPNPEYYQHSLQPYQQQQFHSSIAYELIFDRNFEPSAKAPQQLRLGQFHLEDAKIVAKSAAFTNQREVTARFRVHPGQYVIVPSTYEPGQDGQFLLRVFCSGQLQTMELQ